ncbi:tryptophan--tRNA ligase [Candidatus Falkowbacteria bacterium RBG_13_39_14]|uniref:Tryptophan--tRNA ligase n=1 Tax=Candidatus Falkowbacteria bacterium RBG_13_39_14 TaxID=1797985 RepID=A0A1F5S7P5_9BACT|nr:MAG: tryptophan--tRNA ligase [Candidatus Falkowbacteria bacterium RBG_13_39_14]
MNKKIVLSGTQPSGELHIGNYLGALKNWVALQDKYECFFFIADYHSLSENYNPKEKARQILDLAIDYLAAGIDPKKCAIFVQSDVPECAELAWIFNTITPVAYLERMTQYKDKALKQEQNINMALLDYPVLQAADILMYNADFVPVGNDQDQHVELTRTIARFFNNRFGETFKEPEGLHSSAPRIMSLTAPSKKMSKSDASGSYIALTDSPEEITKKIKRATTDIGEKAEGAGISGGENLLALLDYVSDNKDRIRDFVSEYKNGSLKYSELKPFLAEEIIKMLAPIQERRKKLEKDIDYVRSVLENGANKARKIAKETMEVVKKKVGVRY